MLASRKSGTGTLLTTHSPSIFISPLEVFLMHVVASFVGSFVACCVLLLTRCALVRCAVILALFGYVCMEMRDKDRRLLPIKEFMALCCIL